MLSHGSSGVYIPYEVISDGAVRVLFRVYFIAVMLFIALAGSWACRVHVRHALLTGHTVPLTATTGWLQGPALAKILVQVRRIPGAWLGWLMLLATALDLIGEFGVAKSVTLIERATRSTAATGMIVDGTHPQMFPDIEFQAYSLAASAQLYSYSNGLSSGLDADRYGIYRFITQDFTFMASSEDIIGKWYCIKTTQQPIVYDQQWKGTAKEIYDTDIWEDLYQRGLLYHSDEGGYYFNRSDYSTGYSSGPSSHTTILSASDYKYGSLFDIKAAVDVQELDELGSKAIDTFFCQLKPLGQTTVVEDIARQIDIGSTIGDWIGQITGSLTPDLFATTTFDTTVIETTLGFFFNSMIMVAGSGQAVTSTNSQGYTYGAVQYVTIVPYWVIFICITVAVLGFSLLAYAIWLYIAVRARSVIYDRSASSFGHVKSKEIRDNTPVGMLDWMTHAAYESRDIDQIPKTHHLKDWILSTTWHAERRLGVVRRNELGHVNPLRTPGSTPAVQSGYFPAPLIAQKGYIPMNKQGYISVETSEIR